MWMIRCSFARPPSTASSSGSIDGTPVPPASAVTATEDGQSLMAAKDYANTRYSGLDEINTGNASRLRVAWTFLTGVVAGHEAAPVVVGSTMFLVSPFPNYVYALDLSQPGAPMKWKYEPKPASAAKGVACCDVVNRGVAFWNGSIYFNTLDGRTIALDANTGAERWTTTLGDLNRGETITMAPIVVTGKVLVGNSGGEFGVRGWLAALDATALTGGNPRRGIEAIGRYGCGACHDIPGIRSAKGNVGPSLAHVANRSYLGGQLPNTPANLVRWIQHPQHIERGTAMPEMGVTDTDAKDIAAYLYTLR
jgi:glucose dehydrogenase